MLANNVVKFSSSDEGMNVRKQSEAEVAYNALKQNIQRMYEGLLLRVEQTHLAVATIKDEHGAGRLSADDAITLYDVAIRYIDGIMGEMQTLVQKDDAA